jgi:hypothetical protein
MSDSDEPEAMTPLAGTDSEVAFREVLGLFDAPAFARRGHEVEYALKHLRERLGRERNAMLDMVRLRLRQWASVATGPDDGCDVFADPVAPLWTLTSAEPPSWSDQPAPARRRRAVARDLVASVTRFNRRWTQVLDRLVLDSINHQIEQFNRYYVLEKECIVGSARLASRHFQPKPLLTREGLRAEFPALPVPGLVE